MLHGARGQQGVSRIDSVAATIDPVCLRSPTVGQWPGVVAITADLSAVRNDPEQYSKLDSKRLI